MELKLVIFLAFTSVTVVTNTLLIWFGYKAFASLTSKVTQTVTEFETSGVTREWIVSMQAASERAVTVTASASQKMLETDSALAQARERYAATLEKVDSRLEEAAEKLSGGARKVRDTVARPAFTFMSFMAGLARGVSAMLDDFEN